MERTLQNKWIRLRLRCFDQVEVDLRWSPRFQNLVNESTREKATTPANKTQGSGYRALEIKSIYMSAQY
jgi:hypothetical protein